jgi:hypothetical protein
VVAVAAWLVTALPNERVRPSARVLRKGCEVLTMGIGLELMGLLEKRWSNFQVVANL